MAEPIAAQKAPYGVELEAGKDYWWCACGHSAAQPFCDGSHKAVGLAPMKFTATEIEAGLAMRVQIQQQQAVLRRHA